MAHLPVEITHSLAFLNTFIHSANDIYKDALEAFSKIDKMKIDDEHYGRELRDIAKVARDHADKAIERELDSYQIFNKEITDIISKKNNEEVIYIMSKYSITIEIYEKLHKNIKNTIDKYENKKNVCTNDKDFIRVIAYNKVLIPLYKIYDIMDHIISRLSTLIGKE